VNTDIFQSASLKLTSLYLIIIMSISLIFSFGFYRISVSELERGIHRQPGPISQIFRSRNIDLLEQLRIEQDVVFEAARARLEASLILINLFILVGGGMLSYYLARRTLKPIEEVHEAQSRFTADASHELRTPIAAMRLETELSLTDEKLTLKQAKEQLQSNIEELDKLTALSEGLLQLARLDNDKLTKSNTKVRSMINDAVQRVIVEAEKKKQIISTKKIDKGSINVNQSAVTEAIVTLLDNAIKYSPEKSEITVTTNRTKNTLAIEVRDNGIGIDPIDLERIFDRFYRADSSRTKGNLNGYGIGLSIAKSVAESHGGSITAESKPNNGSVFTLIFPVK
jgi:signal transduction histidine kinase